MFSQPVSLNTHLIDTSFDAPVAIQSVSFCIYSDSLYPQNEVYREYIVLAFSVIKFDCLSICL